MNETLRLGTIAGIRVGVNWSVLIIFWLLLVGLAAGRFPAMYPDHSATAYGIAGAVAAIVFFASLLAHELAHALVAERYGLEVEGITLWMFGGVARLRGDAPNPSADLRIAGVGPLVSLVLGAVFGAIAVLARGLGVAGLPFAVLSWLAVINVLLAAFNLVPAAPLDGGRILRALIWRRKGDRLQAALVATRAGRQFGFVMIGLGIVLFLMMPGGGGLWLALIGWFIASSAGAEEQRARLQRSLQDRRVADVMSPDPVTVPDTLTVGQLLDAYLLRHRYSAYPVVSMDGSLQGLTTLQRVKEVPPEDREVLPIMRVACPAEDVPRAAPDDRLVDVLPAMGASRDGRLVVVDAGRIVGIVSATDVARAVDVAELRTRAG
ncbi:site-2 protease family protein [Egicoccus sp. AB-alg2]|uniref:site-2 protease family protein n=1 Tax=Egicoccus sp. AB-alg2 TaxID=3242693 RepID=UPI00359D4A14